MTHLLARETLVVSIVPFSYIFRDLNFSVAADAVFVGFRCGVVVPWEFVPAAHIQELKGSSCAVTGGDVAETLVSIMFRVCTQ